MKRTGELLKAKRESLGLSISEIALATKINPKVIASMEAGEESKLPAKTILKGFVRSYALYLKLDLDDVLRVFHEEMGASPTAEAARAEQGSSSRRRVEEENSSGLRTAAVIVIVVLIGMIIGVRELMEKYQKEKVVVTDAASGKTEASEAPEASEVPVTSTEGGSDDKVAEDSPEVDKSEVAPQAPKDEVAAKAASETQVKTEPAKVAEPEMKTTGPGPGIIAPKAQEPKKEVAKSEAEKPKELQKDLIKESAKAVEPAPVGKIAKREIILEALDKVELKFQIKGEVKRVSLAPTQVHTIHTDQPLNIDVSDGGAVNVILNGRDRGVPGDLGKPKTVRIP